MELGLAASRQRARELIEGGDVLVDGIVMRKPAAQLDVSRPVVLRNPDHQWVGRGALKLLGVLDPLGVEPKGRVAADLGSSTGGFTEVLLSRGAERVYAVDVGRGLLHSRLMADERVVLMEGVNARHLESLPEPVSLIVGDLSFISLSKILPAVLRLLAPGGEAVLLVKPQFEAGRAALSAGGKVKSPEAREAAIQGVVVDAVDAGFEVLGQIDSPVAGARAGNVERFLHLRPAHGVV